MTLELTQDKSVIIIYRQHNVIVYHDCIRDRSWIMIGKCKNNSSICDKKLYELDCPVTPEYECNCGLIGEWVNNGN